MGQFAHAIRRNLNMLYVIENNGVYGLTKGQFSASADIGSKAKYGEVNEQTPIDPVRTALTLGATFVARSFSGDKEQLVPLIKAAITHRGFALIWCGGQQFFRLWSQFNHLIKLVVPECKKRQTND